MESDRTRSPWAAPKPPTRSLAWPAPTCESPSHLPDGTRVRTPNGSTGVIEGRDGNEYEVFSAADGITYLLSDRDITKSRKPLGKAPKPRKARPVRKVKPAPTTPGYLGALKSLSWRNWTNRYRHTLERAYSFTITRKQRMLNGKPVTKGKGGHTAACVRRMNGRGVGFIRTKGCPGCAKLGKKARR